MLIPRPHLKLVMISLSLGVTFAMSGCTRPERKPIDEVTEDLRRDRRVGLYRRYGWIALALVVFASWKPWRVLLGAYLFGGLTVLQLNLQAAGVAIPVEYLAMSPYVITIVVLVILSADKSRAPAALGRVFHATR